MQKKITDKLTMTSNDKNTLTQTDFYVRLTRLDQLCNWIKTINKEEKRKCPRFAFLKIYATAEFSLFCA